MKPVSALFLLVLCSLCVHAQTPRWLVHYTAETGGFETVVQLVNTDFTGDVAVTLLPFAADGTALTQSTREVTVPPGAKLGLDRQALEWSGLPVSHVQVDAPDSARVSARFRALTEGAMPADAASTTEFATVMRFAPAGHTNWFDGVVAVNSNDVPAFLDVASHDAAGTTVQTVRVDVPAGGKWLAVTDGLFDVAPSADGFVELRSDQPLAFLVLRGSLGASELPVLTQVTPDTFANVPAELTFNNQIGRILQRECTSCHHAGGIGPFELTNYGDTAVMRDFIYDNVSQGLMPPWLPRTDCEPLEEVRQMDPAEKAMLLAWVQGDVPQGEPARAPEPEVFLDPEWKLGNPSAVMFYDEGYVMPPGPDQYRCFPADLNNTVDVTLAAIEILPGNPEVVHHVLVFADLNGQSHTLDSIDNGPGYTCFGGPGTNNILLLGGWAPGMDPLIFPDDAGMTLPPNTTIIFQVHYSYNNSAEADQTRVGLYLDPLPREKEMLLLPLQDTSFVIPADTDDVEVTATFTLPTFASADMHLIAPHMHLIGRTIGVELTYPDLGDDCLIDIPRWDFNWQRFYSFTEPVHLPGGSTVTLRCVYDNTSANPNNPSNPPQLVRNGEATTDEMALAIIGVTTNLLGKTSNRDALLDWWEDVLAGRTPE